jgi:hypothetical protein
VVVPAEAELGLYLQEAAVEDRAAGGRVFTAGFRPQLVDLNELSVEGRQVHRSIVPNEDVGWIIAERRQVGVRDRLLGPP